RGWSHVLAFVASAALGGVMIGLAPGAQARTATIIYVLGLCTMLGVSSLYHRVRWGESGMAFMRRLDHSTIFLAIAGTYTPIAVLSLSGWQQPAVLVTVWAGTFLGIALQWLPLDVPRWLSTAVYAAVGWVAFIALPQLFTDLGPVGFGLVLGGGIAYTLGAVVYATKWPDPWPAVFGFHEVFHACTVVGAGMHLAAVGLIVLPSA
ncbi:MAG TPA: hemolysin III family protein, partial [Microthrixaceae bacterium]|nr:hemolysin III family protein [Microthrixaceae bacterium]